MNDDEQHLVMLGGRGTRLLKREQLLKIEITRVSQRRHIRHAPCARARVNGGSTAPSGDVKSTRLPTLLASSRDCSIHLPPPRPSNRVITANLLRPISKPLGGIRTSRPDCSGLPHLSERKRHQPCRTRSKYSGASRRRGYNRTPRRYAFRLLPALVTSRFSLPTLRIGNRLVCSA